MIIMHTLETPDPKDALLSCMKAFKSRDWSMILFWFAWRCSVDWDVAGPFDSDAPILVQVFEVIDRLEGLLLAWGGQVPGESVKTVLHAQEKNEEKLMFAEEDVEHLEKWEVEMGVI